MPVETAAARFGLGELTALPEEVGRGAMGRVWKVTTATGAWAVKELFWGADAAGAERDAAFQESALAAGIRLPRPVRVLGTGAVLLEVGGVTWRAYGWVDLPPPPDAAGRARLAAEVGDVLGRMHVVGAARPWLPDGDDHPVHAWYRTSMWSHRWAEFLDAGERAGAPWVGPLAALLPEIRALEGIVRPAAWGAPILCHRDLTPDNLLPGPVVIDWEDAGPCDPRQELASVALLWCGADAAALAALVGAYRAAGGPAELARGDPGAFAIRAAIWLNYLALNVQALLEEPAPGGTDGRQRAFASQVVEGLVAHPLRAASLERAAENLPEGVHGRRGDAVH